MNAAWNTFKKGHHPDHVAVLVKELEGVVCIVGVANPSHVFAAAIETFFRIARPNSAVSGIQRVTHFSKSRTVDIHYLCGSTKHPGPVLPSGDTTAPFRANPTIFPDQHKDQLWQQSPITERHGRSSAPQSAFEMTDPASNRVRVNRRPGRRPRRRRCAHRGRRRRRRGDATWTRK